MSTWYLSLSLTFEYLGFHAWLDPETRIFLIGTPFGAKLLALQRIFYRIVTSIFSINAPTPEAEHN